MKKIIAFIQARLGGATRFGEPKVLKEICGKTVIEHIYNRVKQCKNINDVFFVIPNNELQLEIFLSKHGIKYLTGDHDDVLNRFYESNKVVNADCVVRLTCDCPLLDYKIIDKVIEKHLKEENDITTNALLGKETFPDGFDCSIFNKKVLNETYNKARGVERKHVVPYMYGCGKYKIGHLKNRDIYDIRLTLDYPEDFQLIKLLYELCYEKNNFFGFEEIKEIYRDNPEIFKLNSKYTRDSAYYLELAKEKINV